MIPTILNALAFYALFMFYINRVRRINGSAVILCLYAVVAVLGIVFCNMGYWNPDDIQFWPYLYFFVLACATFYPIIKADERIDSNFVDEIQITKSLNILVIVYLVCSLAVIYGMWTNIISKVLSGDWQSVKVDAYSGTGEGVGAVVAYAAAFAVYFRFLIIPYCFYRFSKDNYNFYITMGLLLVCLLSTLFHYLLIAYRGGLFSILVMGLISYLYFQKEMSLKVKKKLWALGGVFAVGVMFIALSITASRFEETDSGTGGSIIEYFGQPMVNYNCGIATRATDYMDGKYFFMSHWKLDKDDFWIDSKYNIETNDGSDFDTLIGCFFIDFGPILTVFIILLSSAFLALLFSRKISNWSTIYLLFFYMDLIVAGVFHGPSSLSQLVVNAIIIYSILFVIERKQLISI